MTALGWLGVGLLIAGAAAVAIECFIAGVWTARVSRRSRELARRLDSERGLIESDLERLRLAMEETRKLWQPYRRLLRFVRHPLAIALARSFARRYRAAARG